MKILIIEDDIAVSEALSTAFKNNGYIPKTVNNGIDGQFEGEEGEYEAIILDLGLPDIDGLSILRNWREKGIDTPVIVLTGRDNIEDVVTGLDAGADDYVVKRTDVAEIMARVRTHIRRSKNNSGQPIKCKDITFDPNGGCVYKGKTKIILTEIEFLIVQYLFLNQGSTISSTKLVEHIYEDYDYDSRVIPRHIVSVRKKLGDGIVLTDSRRGYYVPVDEE